MKFTTAALSLLALGLISACASSPSTTASPAATASADKAAAGAHQVCVKEPPALGSRLETIVCTDASE